MILEQKNWAQYLETRKSQKNKKISEEREEKTTE